MAFLSPAAAARDDYSRILASPAQFLPSPLAQGLFASPAPAGSKATYAVHEGRLSFDVLLHDHDSQESTQGACALEPFREGSAGAGPPILKGARSASHLELYTLAGQERPKLPGNAAAPTAAAAASPVDQQQLQAALTDKVMAKVVAAKQLEVQELVVGVATKFGLTADYGQVEETIKAVWNETGITAPALEELPPASAHTAAAQQQRQTAGAEELTLADQGKGCSDNTSREEEEGGQQATSTLKPLAPAAQTTSEGGNPLKRQLEDQPGFSFRAPAHPVLGMAGAVEEGSLKKRRVQYERMQELEAQVQRVRHLGDALKQSLRQAEAQHTAITMENEQLWNALVHIHTSLRVAHQAHLRQQAAIHAAAMAAALPLPAPPPQQQQATSDEPSPNLLFGNMFSPDAEELAAACGMFISPAKPASTAAVTNKPRKLFLEEESKAMLGSAGRVLPPSGAGLGLAELPAELSPALWVHAA